MANIKVAVVYSCCSVASWGYATEPCWSCGKDVGRDAWLYTGPDDYDGLMARKTILCSDIVERTSPI